MNGTRDLLLIGGTGVISSAVAVAALAAGHRITMLTRGRSGRPVPDGPVERLTADIHDPSAARASLAGRRFDAAVSFVGYSAADVATEATVLDGLVDQLVFISTCSVYQRPAATLPIGEDFPRASPRFDYPAGKIEAEDEFWRRARVGSFAGSVVRAAHVYDERTLPLLAGWTAVDRFRRGRPVVVHGDGSSLWNLLHARDFATGLLPLLANPAAFGRTVQLTAPGSVSWDMIFAATAAAAGVDRPWLVHRSSEDIGGEIAWMGLVCQEDFGHSVVYDQRRARSLLPGWEPTTSLIDGLRETVGWLDAHPDQRTVSVELDDAMERLAAGRPAPW